MTPKDVRDLDLVFPTTMEGFLPAWDDIPKEFKGGKTEWNKLFSRWFYRGLPEGTKIAFKDGIDRTKALRHLRYCMGSFEPKHEHKEAGCAYLYSLWIECVEIPEKEAA